LATHDPGRATALSLQLAQAHQQLRRQIRRLKAGLGQPGAAADDVLVVHCLAFCAALRSHHEGEDAGIFAELLRARPDLEGTIAKLVEDHQMIASILSRVAELADDAKRADGPILEAISRELDGLTAIMESHFAYEEREIGRTLG